MCSLDPGERPGASERECQIRPVNPRFPGKKTVQILTVRALSGTSCRFVLEIERMEICRGLTDCLVCQFTRLSNN